MKNKFSIVTVYWGDHKSLDEFIDDSLQWTDDVVVVYIDLHNDKFISNKANVVYLDHYFLLNNGYADTFNFGINHAKYDWTYIIGVGKKIVSINEEILSCLDQKEEAAFASVYHGKENGTRWFKFSNRTKAILSGAVHEEPVPIGSEVFSDKIFASWIYLKPKSKKDQNGVDQGYRALSRLKWYYLFNTKIKTDGPSSFQSSMKELRKQWKISGARKINELYKKYLHLYDLEVDALADQLKSINEWKRYDL
jgi:hypothetical protein